MTTHNGSTSRANIMNSFLWGIVPCSMNFTWPNPQQHWAFDRSARQCKVPGEAGPLPNLFRLEELRAQRPVAVQLSGTSLCCVAHSQSFLGVFQTAVTVSALERSTQFRAVSLLLFEPFSSRLGWSRPARPRGASHHRPLGKLSETYGTQLQTLKLQLTSISRELSKVHHVASSDKPSDKPRLNVEGCNGAGQAHGSRRDGSSDDVRCIKMCQWCVHENVYPRRPTSMRQSTACLRMRSILQARVRCLCSLPRSPWMLCQPTISP